MPDWMSYIPFVLWLHMILYQTNLCIRDVEFSNTPEAWQNCANAWIKLMTYLPLYMLICAILTTWGLPWVIRKYDGGGEVTKRVMRWTPKVVWASTVLWWLFKEDPDYSK